MAEVSSPLEAAKPRAYGRLAVRIAAGAAVLLRRRLVRASSRALGTSCSVPIPWLFALAVLVSIASNILSAMRWAVIARGLALIAPTARLILMYARAITTNMLLPGATLSGDLLRSVQLVAPRQSLRAFRALGVFRPVQRAVDPVRVVAVVCGWVVAVGHVDSSRACIPPGRMALYLLVLAGIAVAPFIPLPVRSVAQRARNLGRGNRHALDATAFAFAASAARAGRRRSGYRWVCRCCRLLRFGSVRWRSAFRCLIR